MSAWPAARRTGAQAGVTLIEVLIAVVLTAIIVVPVSAWTVSTIRQQQAAQSTLTNARSTGALTSVFTTDIAAARSIAPTGGDCVGGEGGSGTVRLAIVAGGLDQTRIVYSEARPSGAPSTSPERSLWRRVCAADGSTASASEIVESVLPGSTSLACPNATVPAPTVAAACSEPANRRVSLSVTPTGPGDSPSPIVALATRRANADSIGVPGSGNRPPIAQIAVTPLVGYVNTPFSFSAAQSEDLDGTITAFDWEFPAAAGTVRSSGQDVQHSFSQVGEQTVLLTVTDNGGATNVAAVTVLVVNRFPVGAISVGPALGIRGVDEFVFDATGSFDPDDADEPLTYRWDLGPDLGPDRFKTGKVVKFVFPASTEKGQRQITLRVTDSLGGTDTLVRAVGLVDELPDPAGIVIAPEPVLVVGKSPRIGSVGNGLPPLVVSFSRPAGAEVEAGDRWLLVRLSNGTQVASSTAAGLTHTFASADAGEYQLRLLNADDEAIADPVVFRVNAAPSASFATSSGSTDAPRTVQFDPAASADPDGSVVAWRWNFGFFDLWTSTTMDPTHVFTQPGRYTVRLEVTDDDGATSQIEKDIDVTGSIPMPPAPTWSGSTVVFPAIPGAAEYRVAVTCNGNPVNLGGAVAPSAAPALDLPSDACPAPSTASATVQVRKISSWSNPSAAGVRP